MEINTLQHFQFDRLQKPNVAVWREVGNFSRYGLQDRLKPRKSLLELCWDFPLCTRQTGSSLPSSPVSLHKYQLSPAKRLSWILIATLPESKPHLFRSRLSSASVKQYRETPTSGQRDEEERGLNQTDVWCFNYWGRRTWLKRLIVWAQWGCVCVCVSVLCMHQPAAWTLAADCQPGLLAARLICGPCSTKINCKNQEAKSPLRHLLSVSDIHFTSQPSILFFGIVLVFDL